MDCGSLVFIVGLIAVCVRGTVASVCQRVVLVCYYTGKCFGWCINFSPFVFIDFLSLFLMLHVFLNSLVCFGILYPYSDLVLSS